MNKKVIFFAPINTVNFSKKYGEEFYVGAATQKIISICKSLQSVGKEVVIVSSGSAVKKPKSFYRASQIDLENNIPLYFTTGLHYGVLSKIWAALCLLIYSFRNIKRDDVVVTYNFYGYYVPALLLLKFFKNTIVVDVEDAPLSGNYGYRELANIIFFRLIRLLSSDKFIVAASKIPKILGLSNFIVIHGAVSEVHLSVSHEYKDGLNVLYGGTISEHTGLNIFLEAIKLLDVNSVERKINFYVTGSGGEHEINNLAKSLVSDNIKIIILRNIKYTEYIEVVKKSHIGLCLKVPDGIFGETTFPSKVVEMCREGLLVVSTDMFDVMNVFEGDGAYYIKNPYGQSLYEVLLFLSKNTNNIEEYRKNGISIVSKKLGYKSVGEKLVKFMEKK